ncbi:MAG: ABC transporter ATP-binding protein [Bryobacteraceae bacterium]|nr:ABC transporter ATP-binding protein [Bryobacteraceae bacterium]
MDSNIDLAVKNVSKRYRIAHEQTETGGGIAGRLRRMFGGVKQEEFWAVRDASFTVRAGEAVGIIGHNGAGKSTVLKMLSGITTPSEGQIQVRGRLTALLEVGSGFHPELTGRENIFLSGSILGMRRREIHSKLEGIIDFAGVRDFIDVPVKRYSSGMYVRLGFSIAAHLQPDVLLLDEVLAVGDMAFQQKCQQRILELHDQGMTVVFISHDLQAVERVCTRTLVFDHGQIAFDGNTKEAINFYNRSGRFNASDRKGVSEEIHVRSVEFSANGSAAPVTHVCTGDSVRARIGVECKTPLAKGFADLFFVGADGHLQCTLSTRDRLFDLPAGQHNVEFVLPELALRPDLYRVDVVVTSEEAADPLEWLVGCAVLQVNPGRYVRGIFRHPHEWAVVPADTPVPAPRR